MPALGILGRPRGAILQTDEQSDITKARLHRGVSEPFASSHDVPGGFLTASVGSLRCSIFLDKDSRLWHTVPVFSTDFPTFPQG